MNKFQLMQMGYCFKNLKEDILMVTAFECVGSTWLIGYPTTANRSAPMSSKTRYRSSLLLAPSILCNLMIFG